MVTRDCFTVVDCIAVSLPPWSWSSIYIGDVTDNFIGIIMYTNNASLLSQTSASFFAYRKWFILITVAVINRKCVQCT